MIRGLLLFAAMAAAFVAVGVLQSPSVALSILNLCLISAVMALGVNVQWGYAGLFNVGIMGFAALGGLAAVLVSAAPVGEAWSAGGAGVLGAGAVVVASGFAAALLARRSQGVPRALGVAAILIGGFALARWLFDPASDAIEAVDPARTGYLGGLGLPILLGWGAGAALAAGAAWLIGKVSLGLRADYLAIATLGISEIIVSIIKNEDWLSRGVKNVTGLPRPVPYEVDLQDSPGFVERAAGWGLDPVTASSLTVKLAYAALFAVVLLALLWLCETALRSPWGRMMRAIRDDETAAEAMGKDVKARHLQVFVLGSAICGLAGAMLVTLDGQFTPGSYQPLRYTFLIWVMVIVGGSGNNWGAVLGGFLVWFFWIEAEPLGRWALDAVTGFLPDDAPLRRHLIDNAGSLRLAMMGLLLLLTLRFAPRGLLPERDR